MSVEQYQRDFNSIDKEILKLRTKKATLDTDISKIENKIISIQRSIHKNISNSSLTFKTKQISGLQSDKAKKLNESADISKKITQKEKKSNEIYRKLQKEQQNEAKKIEKQQKAIITSYETRMNDLQRQQLQTRDSFIRQSDSVNDNNEEYDFFISHAFEDKEDFVDEFVDELKKQDIRVWYDNDKLKIGDSMRKKIDNGLRKSKYGIVVLSPDYIKEGKYWTGAEFNGLFQMESIGSKIIPIWHKLKKEEVMEYSPMIADRKAANTTNMTASEIAILLKELLDSEN